MRTDPDVWGRSNVETLSDRAEASEELRASKVLASKVNPSAWVLIADYFPPLYDHQSGGLRLKTLIDIIGEQGWPMAFASRSTKSALPGVLSTGAGRRPSRAARPARGVSRFPTTIAHV